MMDEFSYLAVLLSVVIGLAVAQILQGFRARMLSHATVRRFWPVEVWAAILLLICTQTWWALFDLRLRHHWSFDQFVVVLTQTIVLYLLCGLVFPDMPRDISVDLRQHYFTQRRRIFGFGIVSALVSLLRDISLNHSLPGPANLAFHGVFIACALAGFFIARAWFHKILALVFAGIYLSYIVLLFQQLR